MTLHDHVGVVDCIIPWNFPILMMTWKLAPFLAYGCTTVLKSSETTPLTALPVVVYILCGYDPDWGAAIASHPDIGKVAFTWSTQTGRKAVQASIESYLKQVTLKLEGKSLLIICADADLDNAVDISPVGLFQYAGQCCCASSRIFVHEDKHDAFVA